ncbi:MAG: ParA family protein [Enhydrobacter sp.]|nr:ParA family protein [Enhydrobacter sp.]
MKAISVFNNKGGVGKTTLTFHLAHALAEMGHKTLIIDCDPQCNLTIFGMDEERLHQIWGAEDPFIEDFQSAKSKLPEAEFNRLTSSTRSVHFLLKPTEDGVAEVTNLPPPYQLATNLALIPGRLTMHLFEDKISGRWSDVYQGDPLAVRTVTRIRALAEAYSAQFGYEYVIMDTSPSLGALNKVIISTTDGFLIPCMPDMFSLYGIRNIGNALSVWKRQFGTIFQLLSDEKRKSFPANYVRLLGFTVYNAKRYTGVTKWDLAIAHYNYAMKLAPAINDFIRPEIRDHIPANIMSVPVGGNAVMHTHNTFPAMAQRYHLPMWLVPSRAELEKADINTVRGNTAGYEATKAKYHLFAQDLLKRISYLD